MVRILNAAFGSERSTGMAALTFISQENTEDVKICISQHINAWGTEPDTHYIKVIDTELDGKMIAAASWRINEKERTEGQMQSLLPARMRRGIRPPRTVHGTYTMRGRSS